MSIYTVDRSASTGPKMMMMMMIDDDDDDDLCFIHFLFLKPP